MMVSGAIGEKSAKVAVRLPRSEVHRDQLEQFVASRGWTTAERFLPKDDDELNDRLCRGEFEIVAFAAPEYAMEMIWAGHGNVCAWHSKADAAPFEICFAFGANIEANWYNALRRIEISFAGYERLRRRRQTIAGCILTAVALLAMGVLLWTRG